MQDIESNHREVSYKSRCSKKSNEALENEKRTTKLLTEEQAFKHFNYS